MMHGQKNIKNIFVIQSFSRHHWNS